ncbi:glycosyltransferase family 2 protein [Psychrobacter immobilis]|uniref:glycosyltransferase family 2 protein n=1 Tax=Psychrobacter immobilis TaxID=498 RepID=UPI001919B2DC|nr:glycosyltransferase family 2 protein [Psychrobacter immobilis]
MFTVIIPLYNKELSIQATIQSVLDQTYQSFEIVVINDGSTDSSAKIVEEINDDRIRLIHQENQGVSAARNCGIKAANSEWIAFLDGDDLWEVNHLEELIKMMAIFPNEKVYVTSFKYSDNREMFKYPRKNHIFKIENYFKEAVKESLMWTSVVVVHKDCFDKVGYFNVDLNRGEDLDLWTRLARKYKIIKSTIVTAVYRIEAENRSTAMFNIYRSRVFIYSFLDSKSQEESDYYKNQINKALRGFLVNRDLKNFFILLKKHRKNISFFSLLRIKSI